MADKIRVLYICIDPSLGGSTASLYNMIDGIRDNVEPIVLFPERGVGYEHFINHGIESHISSFVRLQAFSHNSLISEWKHPWRWHVVKKWRYDYRCLRFVRKILAGRKVHIVHSNTSPNDIGVLLSRKLHAKHIWHVREFCDLDFHFDIYKGIPHLRKLINKADARIAISNAIKEHWQMPEENTWVINNAIRSKKDACYFTTKENYMLFSSYYLSESKGARNAILAFAESEVCKKGYKLLLMGNCGDEYRGVLMQTIKEKKLEKHIEFVPCQKDVKPYFANATAYLMMSDFEALGRVTAEAMFFGCPVIAHATGGTLDLVRDGETGYLYNTLDECAELIKNVCAEPQEALILRAREYAVNNLSQEVYGPKIMEVYESVLNI